MRLNVLSQNQLTFPQKNKDVITRIKRKNFIKSFTSRTAMKSSDWRGGTKRKHSSECERRHTQTRTFFHSLFTPLKRKWHHPVWWQRATVPTTRGSQSGLALVQRSKKHTGGFCLLFACITWPWFCVMFTLKDNMCRSFLKWPLPYFFQKNILKVEQGQIRQYSMTAWKVDSFFFPWSNFKFSRQATSTNSHLLTNQRKLTPTYWLGSANKLPWHVGPTQISLGGYWW